MQQHKFLTVVGILVVTACGQRGGEPHSRLAHTLDKPVFSDVKWQWEAVTSKDYDRVMQPSISDLTNGAERLEAEHPLLQRSQAWVDAFDRNLRQRYPEQLKNTPKPQVVGYQSRRINAWVSAVPVCFTNVKLVADKKPDIFLPMSAPLGGIRPEGKVFFAMKDQPCSEKELTAEEVYDFVAWYNTELDNCQLEVGEVDEGFEARYSQECRVYGLPGMVQADKLVYTPAANRVIIPSGLAAMDEEEALGSILAHELGHFYRAASVKGDNGKDYGFFYDLEEKNPGERPEADPTLAELGTKVRNVNIPTKAYNGVPNQVYRSELFIPTLTLATTIAKETCSNQVEGLECVESCLAYFTWARSKGVFENLKGFPFRKLDDAGRSDYAKHEKMAGACFAGLKIVVEPKPALRNGEIPIQMLIHALTTDANLIPFLRGFDMVESLTDTLDALSKRITTKRAEALAVLDQAKGARLGYYTREQEADELALEWMVQLGFDPAHAINTELKMGALIDAQVGENAASGYPHAVNAADCRRLYENDWKTTAGEKFFVPIADYTDQHHSTCFRAYNLSREVAAHGYVADPTAQPEELRPEAGRWAAIKLRVANDYANEALEKQLKQQLKKGVSSGLKIDVTNFKVSDARRETSEMSMRDLMLEAMSPDCPNKQSLFEGLKIKVAQ